MSQLLILNTQDSSQWLSGSSGAAQECCRELRLPVALPPRRESVALCTIQHQDTESTELTKMHRIAQRHPNLNLTAEEKRVFYQLFQAADTTNLGVITGEIAVPFFEKTHLPSATLGEVYIPRV